MNGRPEDARPPGPAEARDKGDRVSRAEDVDQSSDDSFPASDPPGWLPLHIGAPGRHADAPRDPAVERGPYRTEAP